VLERMVPRGGLQQLQQFKALQPEGRKRKRPSCNGNDLVMTTLMALSRRNRAAYGSPCYGSGSERHSLRVNTANRSSSES
jgi:hypothetical protein